MSNLSFSVIDARPAAQTAAPAITFRLRIENADHERVHTLALRCHVRIEARARRYTFAEQTLLYELFGEPALWDRSLRGVTWAQTSLVVPSFEKQAEVDLAVPCTYDLQIAFAKYFHAIRDGEVPISFLFNGTIFSVDGQSVRVEPVPWDADASYRMPARVWHAAMDQFFPGGGWLRLDRETIDRLQAFRGRQAFITWDETIDSLLKRAALNDAERLA